MSFDQPTRNALAKMVGDCRQLLTEDIRKQLQGVYGLQPDGTALSLDALGHLDERGHEIARELRDWQEHLAANEVGSETKRRAAAFERLVRETSFTVLNRLAALRLCEERGRVIECVRRGMVSDGFQLFERLSGGALGPRGETYRVFLDRMCDELATDLGVLFDLRDPRSLVFPGEQCLDQVLALLNAPAFAQLWQQDETIGWIYQYFNDPAERKKMREQSAAPRNSHELAVRNQFFTPRYVVEFLTDNTLGRIWYEMTKGQTRLAEQCHYLIRRKQAVFLESGQAPPEPFQPPDDLAWDEEFGEMWVRPNPRLHELTHIWQYALTVNGYEYAKQCLSVECGDLANKQRERYKDNKKWDGTFEELRCCLFFEQRRYRHFGSDPDGEDLEAISALYRAICERWELENEYVSHRPLKDPRAIRLLDPACGSMHFGLYAFDLFEVIYDEAWELEEKLGADALTRPPGMKSLHDTYAGKDAFLKDVPPLIIEHNIHGIDIDPRCTQIAGLSLWLRAQKAWQRLGLMPADRPAIKRSNIVCAEPMPGEKELLREFVEREFPVTERGVFLRLLEAVFDKMQLAGEVGSLLKIEEEIRSGIAEVKKLWREGLKREQVWLFPEAAPPEPTRMKLDLSGIAGEEFWERAEDRIYAALRDYAEQAENGSGFQRRLFAEDAARGFAFVDVCRKRYDVALMNPPFGDATPSALDLVRKHYPEYAENLYVAFHSRSSEMIVAAGLLGIISSRTFVAYRDFERFRGRLLGASPLQVFADFGWEVLDGAQVETAAYVTTKQIAPNDWFGPFFRLLAVPVAQKDAELLQATLWRNKGRTYFSHASSLRKLPGTPLCYWSSEQFVNEVANSPTLYPTRAFVGLGASPHAFFFRAWWEVAIHAVGDRWRRICRGGDYAPFYRPNYLVIDWHRNGGSVKEHILKKYPYLNGNYGWKIQDEDKYGLAGLTWGKRNERFNVQAMPADHIFTDEGQGIIPANLSESAFLLGYMNSALVAYFLSLTSGLQKHYVYIRPVPVLQLPPESVRHIEIATTSIVEIKQKWDSTSETSPLFTLPLPSGLYSRMGLRACASAGQSGWERDSDAISSCRAEINGIVFSETALSADDVLEIQSLTATFPKDVPNIDGFIPSTDGIDGELAKSSVSHWLGLTFGRWDIRYATGEKAAPELPDPFAPLPACPPGMMKNAEGLPAGLQDVPTSYPLRIAWDGILVDDPNHSRDIERWVRNVIEVIWKERAAAIEHEACELLGTKSLREYFRKPSGFFADHLKLYSKSRRQAPIYWPLSTASGSYTLWFYYHRLTDQTLYACVNDFVQPKLNDLAREILRLRDEKRAKELQAAVALQSELEEFKQELLAWAPRWKPNLNDGVLITACPLWKLFRLPKWRKDLEACWKKLEAGDYDWAHLAYSLWPDRVREECKKDRSIAIAHGLEEICEVPPPQTKGSRRGRKAPRTGAKQMELDTEDIGAEA